MSPPNPCRAALWAVFALVHAPAFAQEPVRHVSFAWVRGDGADGCPAQPVLMAAVRARINRDPFSESATVTAEASVVRVEERWRVRLTFRDAQGAVLLRRDLEDGSESCATIADAVVLSVSLGLAPAVDDEPRAVDREVAPRVVLNDAPVRASPPAPVAPRERAWSTLAVEGLYGVLPGLAFGVVWRLDIPLTRRWGVWLSASFNPQVSLGDANEWTFGLKRVSAGACVRFMPRAWLELAPCAGVSVGAVNAVTYGLQPVDPGEYLWPAAVVVPRVTVRPWRRLVIEATATVAAAISREFAARRAGVSETIYKQDDIAFAATLGLGVEF